MLNMKMDAVVGLSMDAVFQSQFKLFNYIWYTSIICVCRWAGMVWGGGTEDWSLESGPHPSRKNSTGHWVGGGGGRRSRSICRYLC